MPADEGKSADDQKNLLSEHNQMVADIFAHEDKDKSGFISYDEFSGPKHEEL